MRKVRKTRTRFECETCKTQYRQREEAEECESRPVENQIFQVGERARAIPKRECSAHDKKYQAKGTIIEVRGPFGSDEEYEIKWLGGKCDRLKSHVFSYILEYQCPHCGEKRTDSYYAPELEKCD